jgi:ABC-2 type transport system permease protein
MAYGIAAVFGGGGMTGVWRLFLVFARIGALNELAYRAHFWVQAIESLLGAVMTLGAVGVVYTQTDALAGWGVWELTALTGVYFIVLGMINLVLSPSMNQFMRDVQQGTLDFTLTKPEDAQILVSISQVHIWKLIDVAMGGVIVVYAVYRLGGDVGWSEALLFGTALVTGGVIVYSFWMILATLAFWFIRIENIFMIFWSMYMAGRWPVSLYPGWLRWLLTGVAPIAFAVTTPSEAITGRLEWGALMEAGGLGVGLFIVSRVFWRYGVRYYSGASA